MQLIKEGLGLIENETADVVSKDLPVFYNPVMRHNRDVGLLLFSVLGKENVQACDLLAGSGVRSIRMLKELPGVFEHITINDGDLESFDRIQKNLDRNKLDAVVWTRTQFIEASLKREGPGSREGSPRGEKKTELPSVLVTNMDALQLLLASNGYDYIDIDPFGSPNKFLDLSVRRMSREGILAVTATDTSALAGSYPDACRRKYWAVPCEGDRKHEVGLRILIRKCQLIAAQYEKALTPILVYNKDHYYRAYFRVTKGKQKVDTLLAQHGSWDQETDAGPLWLGSLGDPHLIAAMIKKLSELNERSDQEPSIQMRDPEKLLKWLEILRLEYLLAGIPFYFAINMLNKEWETSHTKEHLLKVLEDRGSPTHHDGNAIKSELSSFELFRKLNERA